MNVKNTFLSKEEICMNILLMHKRSKRLKIKVFYGLKQSPKTSLEKLRVVMINRAGYIQGNGDLAY